MPDRPIYLKQLELGPMQNFVYLLGDPQTKEAAVVDPGWEVPKILAAAEADGYRLTRVLLTHSHFDHVMGLGELLKAVDVPVHIHDAEVGDLSISPSAIEPVTHGEVIHVGSIPITLVHTPGHTEGSQCLLADNRLLSGDTLFIGGCGRCDLPGGNPGALYHSLAQTLKRLDDRTQLYPGHNYAQAPHSTLGEEKQRNPFLQPKTLQEFLHLVGAALS